MLVAVVTQVVVEMVVRDHKLVLLLVVLVVMELVAVEEVAVVLHPLLVLL